MKISANQSIKFYSESLDETVEIFELNGKVWYEWTNGLESEGYATFEKAFAAAKKSEREMIQEAMIEAELENV